MLISCDLCDATAARHAQAASEQARLIRTPVLEFTMQQQQQQLSRLPTRISCPLPFAHIHTPSWLHKHHHHGAKLSANFSGTWVKDKAASDPMNEAIALMGLSGLMRQAIRLIKGIKITQDDSTFTMAVFSVFSWFKVSERYGLDGSISKGRRRDLRRGGYVGTLSVPAADKVQLNLQWNDPFGGTGSDTFVMPAPGLLHVDSHINVNGKTCKYRTVYKKQ